MKKGRINFVGADPMHIEHSVDVVASTPNEAQEKFIEQVAGTVKEYLKSASSLLETKYAHIKTWAPTHLANPGNVLVVCCPEGIVIRYESKTDKRQIFGAWMSEDLPYVASLLSQRIINCHRGGYAPSGEKSGSELILYKQDPLTGQRTNIATALIGVDAPIEIPKIILPPPHKPFCLISIQNSIETQILAEFNEERVPAKKGQRFILRDKLRLQVGWECIEVFPFVSLEHWQPEFASIWAENDLLASVTSKQFQEAHFHSLDPNSSARKQYTQLLNAYKDLLDSNPEREETLQVFLRDNPFLLCPPHTRMWPKLPLGAHITDFVFQEATGEYLLVELERSTHPLFLKNGHPSSELNHARGQITDWKRYLVVRQTRFVG